MVRSNGIGFKAAYGQVYRLFGICAESRSRETLKSKYPIGYLMFIITAKYRVSSKWNDQTDGIYTGHPYATTRTRTYTKGEGGGRAEGKDARIDKARTDKGRNFITYLNIDQLKTREYIRIFDQKEKKEKKKNRKKKKKEKTSQSVVNRVRVVASRTLFDTKNQSIYISIGYTHIHIYAYTYNLIRVSLSTHMQGSSLHVRMYRYICYD